MSAEPKKIYRVTWTLSTTEVETSTEFGNEGKAEDWARALAKFGARKVSCECLQTVYLQRYDAESLEFPK